MGVVCLRVKLLVVLYGLICLGPITWAQDTPAAPDQNSPIDIQPPVIEYEPRENSLSPGQSTVLTVKVTDDMGVREVILFYRTEGDPSFKSARMIATSDAFYSATLSSTDTRPPGLEYFIQAVDKAGNSVWRASKMFPLKLEVAERTLATPVAVIPPLEKPADEERGGRSIWWWVLGALAAGAVVAASGGDNGGEGGPAPGSPPAGSTGSVQVTTPTPP